jgi:hypothetical protein
MATAGVLALLALAACEKKPTAPITNGGGAPPAGSPIAAVFPAPRSVHVPDATEIWAEFSTDLDTATVNGHNVFFKLDTQRLPITIAWDAATRRIRITPLVRLALRRTYTVELTSGVETSHGVSIGPNYLWQFTTSGLRFPQLPHPVDGALGESPYSSLRWGGLTEAGVGAVRYEVHAGADPAVATDTSGAGLGSVPTIPFLPRVPWTLETTVYWAVHAINLATGERVIGPVWHFTTLPAATTIDSLVIDADNWSWNEAATPATRRCQLDSFAVLPSASALSVMKWRLAVFDTTIRLAGAKIEFSPRRSTIPADVGPTLWYANSDWVACTGVTYPGPPFTDEIDGKLADAFVVAPDRIRFASDRLTAHIEATMRYGGLYGYVFRAPRRMTYWGSSIGFGAGSAQLKIYRYRPAPAPTLSARPARGASSRGRRGAP